MEAGKGKGKENCKGKGIVKHTPGGGDIYCAIALKWQKKTNEADSDMEGKRNQVYFEPETLPAVLIRSDDDTDCTMEYDGKYVSQHQFHLDVNMQDDVDALCGIDLHGDVDMERDGDDEEEQDEEEEDEEEEDEEEEDEDEKEDEYEDDGKEPQTIGQGEMVNTSADGVDTMVDDQPMELPE